MEVGGFKVKLDLSEFFSDFRKFTCMYVDLSRDRQIADVADRISELFGIERPLCLLDERFYLPDSENVKVLRESNIVKVWRALHSQAAGKCYNSVMPASGDKATEFMKDVSISKQNHIFVGNSEKPVVSESLSSHDLNQNAEEANTSLLYSDTKESQCMHGKKRKKREFDDNSMNQLQQTLEPETHYQKKCKRKKEKIRKDYLSDHSLEQNGHETEERGTCTTQIQRKCKKERDTHSSQEVNGDCSEGIADSVILTEGSLKNVNKQSDLVTHKKKLKAKLPVEEVNENLSVLANTVNVTCHQVSPNSANFKKCKKNPKKYSEDIGMSLDHRLPLVIEKSDNDFLSACSEVIQMSKIKTKKILDHQNRKNNMTSCFADNTISSTPMLTKGSGTKTVTDSLEQRNFSFHDSALEEHENHYFNQSTSNKHKRVRTRKHKRKKNISTSNSNAGVPDRAGEGQTKNNSVFTVISQGKHIRFEEQENDDLSQQKISLENDKNLRNNTTGDDYNLTKDSPKIEYVEEAKVVIGNGVVPVEHSLENNTKSSASSPQQNLESNEPIILDIILDSFQAPCNQHWVSNGTKGKPDPEEALQKLLALGKQNSYPIVFDRKRQDYSSSSASTSPVLVKENDKNATVICDAHNVVPDMDQDNVTRQKFDHTCINPLNYPKLEVKPRKNEMIGFKVLKLTNSYTPEVSDFIIAKVLDFCESTLEMVLQIEVGECNLQAPKGKFSLDDDSSEKKEGGSRICQLNWNELMDVRILYP